MRQLTATDAAFLNLEQPRTPMHLTSLLVFDCSEAPGGPVTFERIRSTIEERSAMVASHRQRLVTVPFDLDYPWCYDDGGKVTAERAFDGIVIEFDDVSVIRTLIEGATVNDVILSVVGGALRRYLTAHGELPDTSPLLEGEAGHTELVTCG